jgi:hypothetical protein
LLPVNEGVISFYNKWKLLGEAAFQLLNIEFTPREAEMFTEKIVLIESYMPAITDARST